MATIEVKNPTIKDVIDGQTPDGKTVLDLVNLLSQENPFMEDAVVRECNQNDQHTEVVMTSMPTIKKRKYNEGVKSSKGTRAKLTDATSIYTARCAVDKDLASLNGGTREFLMRENEVFLDAMAQSVATDVIYGAQAAGNNGLIGFAERYSTLTRKNPDGNLPETADYIIDAGGTGNDLTSLWLVVWGLKTCFMIYPKGSKAGLEVEPTYVGDAYDENGDPYRAHITNYNHKVGLCVKDLRSVVRIANIDTVALAADADKAKLVKFMVDGFVKLKNKKSGKLVIYCNDAVYAHLWKMAIDRGNVDFAVTEVEGKPMATFQGYPIKCCDAIISTEAQVV